MSLETDIAKYEERDLDWKRKIISRAYDNETWRDRVATMSPKQVFAIYDRFVKIGKVEELNPRKYVSRDYWKDGRVYKQYARVHNVNEDIPDDIYTYMADDQMRFDV